MKKKHHQVHMKLLYSHSHQMQKINQSHHNLDLDMFHQMLHQDHYQYTHNLYNQHLHRYYLIRMPNLYISLAH